MFPLNIVVFHSYVSLPKGKWWWYVWLPSLMSVGLPCFFTQSLRRQGISSKWPWPFVFGPQNASKNPPFPAGKHNRGAYPLVICDALRTWKQPIEIVVLPVETGDLWRFSMVMLVYPEGNWKWRDENSDVAFLKDAVFSHSHFSFIQLPFGKRLHTTMD